MTKQTIFSLAEKKYAPLTSYDESGPVAIQTGAKAFCWCAVLGDKPTVWSSDFKSLGGISIPDVSAETSVPSKSRVGDYVQLQHTTLMLNLDMRFNSTQAPPIEFRIIHFRQRRQAMPAGINPDPGTSLFLNIDGQNFGHDTPLINGTDFINQPLNKRKWIIYRDQKFILTKPTRGDVQTNQYKCMNTFNFRFPFNTKAKYGVADLPENVVYHHGIAIYARPIDKDINANYWEVNTRGTTSFVDF